MKTMKTKLALVISAIVSINLVASAIPAQSAEIQLRDMHTAEFCSSGANLADMDLSYTDFSGCDLTGANLSRSDFTGANFDGAILRSAKFIGANMAGSFVGADIYGASLSSATLSGNFDDADFTDSVLNDAHLQGSFQRSNFERTSFSSAFLDGNFDGALFTGQILDKFIAATFTGSFVATTFSNANFFVTNLSQADLSQSNFSAPISGYFGTDLFPKALPRGWTYCGLFGGYFFGPGQDLSNTTLGNGSFCDVSSVNWTGTNVVNSTFNGQSFIGSNLSELMFNNNRFVQIDFSGAKITRSLSGAYFEQAKFVNSDLTESALDHSTMWAADFSRANLANMDFSQSNVYQSDFSGANLSGVDFSGSTLTGVNFSGANLEGANFFGAKLIDVRNLDCGATELLTQVGELRTSEVHHCSFTNIGEFPLAESKFYDSVFSNVNFLVPNNYLRGEFYDTSLTSVTFVAKNGSALKFVGGSLRSALFQKGSDFSSSYFEEVLTADVRFEGLFYSSIFQDMDLSHVSFLDSLNATRFSNCNLTFADFTKALNMNVTFENSDLAHADFSRANLSGVFFKDSNLNGTDFYRTSFESLRTHNVSGSPVNLNKRYILRGGFILGPTVLLVGENLSNFDFNGADLRGSAIFQSDISGARFGNALSLFGVYSSELTGTPSSMPDGVGFIKGKILGPGVSLEYSDFSGVNFGSVDLSFVIFRGARFEGADLSKAKFRGTIFCWSFSDASTLTPSGVRFAKNAWGAEGSFVGPGLRMCPPNASIWLDPPQWFISGSDVSEQNFEGADLRNFSFRYGDFARVNLRNVNLSSTILTGSNFAGADLRGANLTNADFAGAILDGALMTGLKGAPAYLPDGWVYLNGSIIREGSVALGMKLVNSKCASGSEEMAIDGETRLSLLGDASYSNTLSMDTTQGFNAKGSCMVWFIDGAVVPSVNKLTFTPSKSDIGKKVRVGVVRTDLSGIKTIQLSDELLVGKARMNSAVPKVSGVAKVGGRLTALRTTWAPGATYSYQWFRNGTVIEGSTKVSYLPNPDDYQQSLAVKVCATKAYFETKCETSSASAQVAPGGFPKSPVVQLVVGKLTVGSTLVGKPGNWLTGTSLGFQWLRDGVAIQGANLANYTLSSEDRGHVIQFQVTAAKRGYINQVKSSITKSIP